MDGRSETIIEASISSDHGNTPYSKNNGAEQTWPEKSSFSDAQSEQSNHHAHHHGRHNSTASRTASVQTSGSATTLGKYRHFEHHTKPQQALYSGFKKLSHKTKEILHISHEHHPDQDSLERCLKGNGNVGSGPSSKGSIRNLKGDGVASDDLKGASSQHLHPHHHHHHHHHHHANHHHQHHHPNSIQPSPPKSSQSSHADVSAHSSTPAASYTVDMENSVAGSPSPMRTPQKLEDFPSPNQKERRSIKIRLVTWNMYDDLPHHTADLTDFLGDVQSVRKQKHYESAPENGDKMTGQASLRNAASSSGSSFNASSEEQHANGQGILPSFPLQAEHPYHLVVVAGQECPTASRVSTGRIPRTLDGKGWTSMLEDWLCGKEKKSKGRDESSSDVSDSDSDSDSDSGKRSERGDDTENGRQKSLSGKESVNSKRQMVYEKQQNDANHSKSMLKANPSRRRKSFKSNPSDKETPNTDESGTEGGDDYTSINSKGGGDVETTGSRNGPYILVDKVRLMGIYLAVFVHRTCDEFIDGVSKARVTAGLIGGRLGNKGGVAISLMFAGSRILFISAHLAAHASGLQIRKQNVKKILQELEIDDFLGDTDKHKSLPLTDRFDQTFFMGDLNFRLNISRLHADWLLKSNDYTNALRFDQLAEVLADEEGCFKGFKEAHIAFAPTYKYDVPGRDKKHKGSVLRKGRFKQVLKHTFLAPEGGHLQTGSHSPSGSVATDPEYRHGAQTKEDDIASILSNSSSITEYSATNMKRELDPRDKAELKAMGFPSQAIKGSDTSMDSVRRAQVKLFTMVRSNSAHGALLHSSNDMLDGSIERLQKVQDKVGYCEQTSQKDEQDSHASDDLPRIRLNGSKEKLWLNTSNSMLSRPPLRAAVSAYGVPKAPWFGNPQIRSLKSSISNSAENSEDGEDSDAESHHPATATFDTSHKQRVQSYTDRILFKTTVLPDPSMGKDPPEHGGRAFLDSLKDLVRSKTSTTPTPTSTPGASSHRSYFGIDPTSRRGKHHDIESESHQPRDLGHKSLVHHSRVSKLFGRAHRSAENLASPALSRTSTRQTAISPTSFKKAGRSYSMRVESGRRPSGFAEAQSDLLARRRGSALPPLTTLTGADMVPIVRSPGSEKTPTLSDSRRPSLAPQLSPTAQFSPIGELSTHQDNIYPSKPHPSPHSNLPGFLRNAKPHFPRSLTRPSSHNLSGHEDSNSGSNTFARFKTFLSSFPSTFTLTRPMLLDRPSSTSSHDVVQTPRPLSPIWVGPRKGEIFPIEYNAVTDLTKMSAASDHRPVYCVLAVGLGEVHSREVNGNIE